METMRAAVMRNNNSSSPTCRCPSPGPGEVLVKTLACGICGSDLHALRYAEQFVEARGARRQRLHHGSARDVVMGHEFCAEIVELRTATTRALRVGTRVCSLPC